MPTKAKSKTSSRRGPTPTIRITKKHIEHAKERRPDDVVDEAIRRRLRAQKRVVEDAKEPWTIRITADHVKKAECRNPEKCVVAQAIRSALGPVAALGFEGMAVGPRITKVYVTGKEIRFGTPEVLKQSIRVFDELKEWRLPLGEIQLLPPPPSMRLDYVPPPHKRNIKRRLDPNRGSEHRARLSATRTVRRSGTCPIDYSARAPVQTEAA